MSVTLRGDQGNLHHILTIRVKAEEGGLSTNCIVFVFCVFWEGGVLGIVGQRAQLSENFEKLHQIHVVNNKLQFTDLINIEVEIPNKNNEIISEYLLFLQTYFLQAQDPLSFFLFLHILL